MLTKSWDAVGCSCHIWGTRWLRCGPCVRYRLLMDAACHSQWNHFWTNDTKNSKLFRQTIVYSAPAVFGFVAFERLRFSQRTLAWWSSCLCCWHCALHSLIGANAFGLAAIFTRLQLLCNSCHLGTALQISVRTTSGAWSQRIWTAPSSPSRYKWIWIGWEWNINWIWIGIWIGYESSSWLHFWQNQGACNDSRKAP